MEYVTLLPSEPRADLMRKMWRDRMDGTKRKVEVCSCYNPTSRIQGVHYSTALILLEKQVHVL